MEHPAYTPEAIARRAERDAAVLRAHDERCENGAGCITCCLPPRPTTSE